MVRFGLIEFLVLLVLIDLVSSQTDCTKKDKEGKKKKGKSLSTSSSEGKKSTGSSDGDGESLELTSVSSSSSSDAADKTNRIKPKSSEERKGWRKWHRKCNKCPEDMKKKWRDPSIKWICGAYQRARRSFKSECMMHYRNCQDGTMFVKVGNHRCANQTESETGNHGEHFFYEYKVIIPDETSDSDHSSSSDRSSQSFK